MRSKLCNQFYLLDVCMQRHAVSQASCKHLDYAELNPFKLELQHIATAANQAGLHLKRHLQAHDFYSQLMSG